MLKHSALCPGRGRAFGHHVLNGIIWAVTISYPFLIWFFLDYFQPRSLALMLAALFVLGDPLVSGLAISLLFGLVVGTALTLLLIPLLYWRYLCWQQARALAVKADE